MKKFSHLAASFILFASFISVPSPAVADGCPVGTACSLYNDGVLNGVCKQDPDLGEYCGIPGVTALPTGSSDTGAVSQLQTSGGGININFIKPYSDSIINIINGILVPVLMAIAFIVFLWGVFKYFIYGASNESDKAEGRKFAMWGIIGFVIILSVWGIVSIVTDALGLRIGGSAPRPPIF